MSLRLSDRVLYVSISGVMSSAAVAELEVDVCRARGAIGRQVYAVALDLRGACIAVERTKIVELMALLYPGGNGPCPVPVAAIVQPCWVEPFVTWAVAKALESPTVCRRVFTDCDEASAWAQVQALTAHAMLGPE